MRQDVEGKGGVRLEAVFWAVEIGVEVNEGVTANDYITIP